MATHKHLPPNSPLHSWRGVRGEVARITGNQHVAPDKLRIARTYRRELTRAERILWSALRRNQVAGLHFRRQQVIAGFIVDFYCARARLAIELDGDSHRSQVGYDAERDHALARMGIETARISNEFAKTDLASVLRAIAEKALARL